MSDNDQEQQKKTLTDEVLRKIGRNVILFQQIEAMLKDLVANSSVEGDSANLADIHKKKSDKVQKQMMGEVVKQYVDDILSDAGDSPDKPEEANQSWVSFSFNISGTQESYESLKEEMKLMVGERNDLIHHFLPRLNPYSLETLAGAASYLDTQRDKVMPMFKHLESVIQNRLKFAQYMATEEFQNTFELTVLQQSSIVDFMKEVASKSQRHGGWTDLEHAGELAHENILEDVNHMEECYGHKTLKQLLIASELFDVFDEPLPNGKFRTVYRVKKIVQH